MKAYRKRIPITRLGLTLIVGSVAVSLVQFYFDFGQSLAHLDRPDTGPETRPEIVGYIVRSVLFRGAIPAVLFWLGTVAMVVGIVVRIRRIRDSVRR